MDAIGGASGGVSPRSMQEEDFATEHREEERSEEFKLQAAI
jgi:hypothetical protein